MDDVPVENTLALYQEAGQHIPRAAANRIDLPGKTSRIENP